jgi:DNA-binding transcriptional LysR family regulator
VVGFDDSLGHLAAARWLARHAAAARTVARCNDVGSVHALVRAGMGLGALPCFMGDVDPALVRALPPQAEMAGALWLLTHPDLRNTARIRAFLDFMAGALAGERVLLEGLSPQPASAGNRCRAR